MFGAIIQGTAPLTPALAALSFSFLAAAVVLAAVLVGGVVWGVSRLGRMLRVPQYQPRRPNYFGTPAE